MLLDAGRLADVVMSASADNNGTGKLQGKVAIVTGASRGIGRSVARTFAEEGAKVVINYNSSGTEAESLRDEIVRRGGDCLLFKCDVSKSREVKEMVAATVVKYGRIDVLVNNAGIIIRNKILETTEEDWDRTMDVNLKSAYLCSREVAPIMLGQKSGKIVNVSSISGLNGPPSTVEVPAYTASKSGMIGLTRSLAVNLSPFVNVNVVCPGLTITDMSKSMTEEGKNLRKQETPLKRFGAPDEIAKAVLFLSSADSDFITGETLVVSGGRPIT